MKEAHAEPLLHPRHRLADRRRRHSKLPSRNRETSRFCGLNEGIQRSETVHPRTSISDTRVRYVWNHGPLFKHLGEPLSGLCQTASTAWTSCSMAASRSPSLTPSIIGNGAGDFSDRPLRDFSHTISM